MNLERRAKLYRRLPDRTGMTAVLLFQKWHEVMQRQAGITPIDDPDAWKPGDPPRS